MKSKVTLKEIVGTKIVYALLLVCYYWMWARQDWQDYYEVIQHVAVIFTVLFLAIRAGRIYKDGLAIQRLRRIDAIGLKIMAAAVIVIAFVSAVAFMDGRMAGYMLVGTVLALTVIRFILFCVMSRKET